MSMNSVWFYILLMAAFILEAAFLARVLPFHRAQNAKELSSHRLTPLDGLRGILAISVFFLHVTEFQILAATGQWTHPDSNFYQQLGIFPVCMFFFITGYLFWLKLRKSTGIPAGPFFYGRLARLGGVYFTTCLICFGLIAVDSGFHRNISVVKLIAQVLGWLSFFGSGHDMNGIANSRLHLGPAWTLKFEWMFYLSLPFLGWFAIRRLRLAILFGGAAILGLLAAQLPTHGAVHKLLTDYFGAYFDFLAYTFSAGILVAVLPVTPKLRTWAQSGIASVLSLLLIVATLFLIKPEFGPLESALLVLPFACVCLGNTWFGLLSSVPVRFLGRISYSFYLLHTVLFTIALQIASRYVDIAALAPIPYWALSGAVGAAVILVAALSYQYLEFPFLHVGPRRIHIPIQQPTDPPQSRAGLVA
jgi:peptidoglycan/LPS O-acetylase OafA/YrhL